MRSIGKRNITKLKQIVRKEWESGYTQGAAVIRDRVMERIPSGWYDIWESAHAEIDRLVDDELCKTVHEGLDS